MKKRFYFSGLSALVLAALILGTAWATDGSLPGGVPISVAITQPSNSALFSSVPGSFTLKGTASVGQGPSTQADTLLVYVLDVSFSTIQGDGGVGCGGDQNGDGLSNTILDCEIASAKILNGLAVSQGNVSEVGVVVYGGLNLLDENDTNGVAADVSPAAGDQLLTGPATAAAGGPDPDVVKVLNSVFVQAGMPPTGGVHLFTPRSVGSFATNFSAGLSAAVNVVNASAKSHKVIIFMSDGLANTGKNVSTVAVPAGVIIDTFAVGSVSSCTLNPQGLGSLTDVAHLGAPGSKCTPVATAADLPNVIPGVFTAPAQLTGLSLSVDGAAAVDISASATPALPQPGPATVQFNRAVSELTPGQHSLCVKASGADSGGNGDVTTCIQVTVASITLAPASAAGDLGTPGQTHTVTATVSAGTLKLKDIPVSFSILSGPNAGKTGSAATDSNGEAKFTYTAAQGPAGLGTDRIQACFTDSAGALTCANAEMTWRSTTPPEIKVSVDPSLLWPPNHKYHVVVATVVATDRVDPHPAIRLISVTSSEPDNGLGDGDTGNDIVRLDDFTFKLRAERSGSGPGRTYTFTYQATNAGGKSATATATVFVPHNRVQAMSLGLFHPDLMLPWPGDPMIYLPKIGR